MRPVKDAGPLTLVPSLRTTGISQDTGQAGIPQKIPDYFLVLSNSFCVLATQLLAEFFCHTAAVLESITCLN